MTHPPRRRSIAVTLLATLLAACSSFGAGGGSCKVVQPANAASVPDSFVVAFTTSNGTFDATFRKAWSPLGAARVYELVQSHYYDDARFFRVVKNFVAQFGISGDPTVNAQWRNRCIADEPVKHSNVRGAIAFARGDSNTRSVQLYVNLKDNPKLDTLSGFGFPPVGEVSDSMAVVDSLNSEYGEAAPRSGSQLGAEGPSQDSIETEGNAYLQRGWPRLDYIKTARIVREWRH